MQNSVTLIFLAKILFTITSGNCFGRKLNEYNSEGEDKIYIQWRPPVSGWYYYNGSHIDGKGSLMYLRYLRVPPAYDDNATNLWKFEFTWKDNQWNLSQWTKHYHKYILKSIENAPANPIGIGLQSRSSPQMSNVYPYSRDRFSSVLHLREQKFGARNVTASENIERARGSGISRQFGSQTLNFNHGRTDRNRRNTRRGRFEELERQRQVQSTYAKMMDTKNLDPGLKVYSPARCLCQKAYATSLQQEFIRLDYSTEKMQYVCWNRIVELLKQFRETQNIYNADNLVNISTSDNSHENVTEAESVTRRDNGWRPEIYVSDNCNILYFDSKYDTWVVDMEWESKECRSYASGIQYFSSNDSAPCLEYLPPAPWQTWVNPQILTNFNSSKADSNDFFNFCDMVFTKAKTKGFSVYCSLLEW